MGDEVIIFTSNTDNKLFMCDPDDGAYVSEVSLNYTGNPYPFGNCWKVGAGVTAWVNDFITSSMAVWDGSAWSSISNPAGTNGRGMDFEDPYIWETNSSSSILRFEPGGSPTSFAAGVPGQMSGLAVFPLGANLGVVTTCYNAPGHNLYFYEFDGASLTPLGNAPCPVAVGNSLGLTYSESRGTFFWGYNSGGYYIAELDVDLGVGLTPSTWGSIKSSF
ncbi:hypothetical protein JW921_05105 [Candidatus Fermentibacterales bacterium]|nr:hypothetical protein [Candidatus Fermentibacterales bacterium]